MSGSLFSLLPSFSEAFDRIEVSQRRATCSARLGSCVLLAGRATIRRGQGGQLESNRELHVRSSDGERQKRGGQRASHDPCLHPSVSLSPHFPFLSRFTWSSLLSSVSVDVSFRLSSFALPSTLSQLNFPLSSLSSLSSFSPFSLPSRPLYSTFLLLSCSLPSLGP